MSKALIRSAPGVDAEARILVASNPITGEELARLHILGPAEVEALVERSRLAGRSWASLSWRERSRRLRRLRHLIADRSEEISEAVRAETGKALGEAIGGEALVVCDYLHYLERTAPFALAGRTAGTGSFFHRRARVSYEPYGVIGIISPWNYPFTISMSTVATALAAGNGVVLKPSEYTPLIGVLIAELVAEATGYPDLVLAAIGEAATGEAVVRSGVDKIAFTGSVEAGRAVMKAAADSLTPVVLELGGKDAMIVCADADVERAARGAVWAAFLGCGQICQSVERVYVVESIYDQFVQAAVGQARRVKTSDEPEANIGSLIAEFQVKKTRRRSPPMMSWSSASARPPSQSPASRSPRRWSTRRSRSPSSSATRRRSRQRTSWSSASARPPSQSSASRSPRRWATRRSRSAGSTATPRSPPMTS